MIERESLLARIRRCSRSDYSVTFKDGPDLQVVREKLSYAGSAIQASIEVAAGVKTQLAAWPLKG